jgi:hypothetical protein
MDLENSSATNPEKSAKETGDAKAIAYQPKNSIHRLTG